MKAYESLAAYYDAFTEDVDYDNFIRLIENAFVKYAKIMPKLVLDLACGTGSISIRLAQKGYEVVAADRAPDMLMEAQNRACALSNPPLFLCQDMRKLDLYGTVDAAVCCLDGFNYLTRPADLAKALSRVSLFLNPGGLLIFDVNTEEKMKSISGQAFIKESEDVFCVWTALYSEKTRICRYDFDLFAREDGQSYRRYQETHRQRAYLAEELQSMLKDAGLALLCVTAGPSMKKARGGEERLFFIAKKEGKEL